MNDYQWRLLLKFMKLVLTGLFSNKESKEFVAELDQELIRDNERWKTPYK